jgi:hypothetical protein
MKNILFIVSLFFLGNLHAQSCMINPDFIASSKYGFYPTANVGFANGRVGVLYNQSITVKARLDTVITVIGPTHICFTRYELLSPSNITNFGLPPGLALQGIPGDLKTPANAVSCALISGVPSAAGTYTLSFQIKRYGYPTANLSDTCPMPPNANSGIGVDISNITNLTLVIQP